MYTSVTGQSVHDVFVAYTGHEPRDNRWDQNLLAQVQDAMTQLLNKEERVYNYTNAGLHTDLDRTYRNDIRESMRRAGFRGESS